MKKNCFIALLPSLAFLIMMLLKLHHTIDWSWWWITSPLWLYVVAVGFYCVFISLAASTAIEEEECYCYKDEE